MPKANILIVEDEDDIRELLSYTLEREGYDIDAVADGETALKAVAEKQPDLILLDLMLPGIDGNDVCYQLKRNPETRPIPIVMLTAKSEEADEVIGLGIGATDYVRKPFSPKVLTARIKAVLRRQIEDSEADVQQETIDAGQLAIDPIRHETAVAGKQIDLTPLEFKILQVLAASPGRVFTREKIIDLVLGENVFITSRTIDVHIVAMRRKLGPHSKMIVTVRGVGYKLTV